MCAHVAAEREDGRQVDLQDFVPVGRGELVGWVSALDAGAVEQDVDRVAVVQDLGDEGGDGRGGGQVGDVDGCFAA